MGVTLGLLWLTLRDRHAGARRSAPCDRNAPVVVDTASSAQRRAATRSPPASAASALRTRCSRRAWGTALMCGQAASVASCAVAASPAARAATANAW